MPGSATGAATRSDSDDSEMQRVGPVAQRLLAQIARIRESEGQESSAAGPIDWNVGEGLALMRERLAKIGVPPKYRDAVIETVKEKQRPAVEEYLAEIVKNVTEGRGLVIAGPVGTGK